MASLEDYNNVIQTIISFKRQFPAIFYQFELKHTRKILIIYNQTTSKEDNNAPTFMFLSCIKVILKHFEIHVKKGPGDTPL